MRPEPQDPAASSILDWPAQAGVAAGVLRELEARQRKRRRRRAAVTAVCAVLLIATAVVWQAPWRESSTVVLRPAHQTLADGSIVELKDGAEISVSFTPERRNVELKRGEAHFQVAKNKARPFVVLVEGVEVRAVGTAFNVRRVDSGVEVLVTEGTVAVDEPKESRTVAMVEAGRRVVVAPPVTEPRTEIPVAHPASPPVVVVPAAEIAQTLAWRVPRLEFSGTRLSEALPMFNRFSPVQLVLGENSLGSLQVSGVVRADNADALVRLLETNFDIRAERHGEGEIVLRRRR